MTSKTSPLAPLPGGAADCPPNGRKAGFRVSPASAFVAAALALIGVCTPATFAAAQLSAPTAAESMTPDLGPVPQRAPQPRTAEEIFAVLDDNGDGCVNAGEWRLRFMAVFFMLDVEGETTIPGSKGDERLAPSEVPLMSPEKFASIDTDHDGFISAYEYNQAPLTRFAAIPKAKKTCLTLDEFAKFLSSIREEPK